MTAIGNIDHYAADFPIDQISKIIHLILDSWKTFKIGTERLEVPITRKLCAHLRNNKDRSLHFFGISCESPEIDKKGEETGRIDIKFTQGWDEAVYFSFECKRLRIQFKKRFDILAGKYVTEGMCRYFNGQYASGLDKGGMLGYVMDSKLDEAIQDTKEAVNRQKTKLSMGRDEELKESVLVPHKQVKETSHSYDPKGSFTIYHVFLPYKGSGR